MSRSVRSSTTRVAAGVAHHRDVLLDIAFRVRPPIALGEHIAGVRPPEPPAG